MAQSEEDSARSAEKVSQGQGLGEAVNFFGRRIVPRTLLAHRRPRSAQRVRSAHRRRSAPMHMATSASMAGVCPAHAARCRGVRACSSRALMSGFVCSNSVMAAASPVRAAACNGVVAPRGAESLLAGRRLWAVFFLKARFFGAIDVRCWAADAKVPLLVLFATAGRLHTCVDSVNDVFQ